MPLAWSHSQIIPSLQHSEMKPKQNNSSMHYSLWKASHTESHAFAWVTQRNWKCIVNPSFPLALSRHNKASSQGMSKPCKILCFQHESNTRSILLPWHFLQFVWNTVVAILELLGESKRTNIQQTQNTCLPVETRKQKQDAGSCLKTFCVHSAFKSNPSCAFND